MLSILRKFKGFILAIFDNWAQVIFMAAADCELFHSVLPDIFILNAILLVVVVLLRI
jgi:hypothetical protein